MNKKIIFIVIIVVIFTFAISGALYHKTFIADNEPNKNEDAAVNETVDDGDIVEIPVESVKGITKQEAEKLCYSVLGEKDEKTGFIFSFATSGAVETNNKQYYVIRASWLVNNDHSSYIGDFFVSADGKEVYNGFVQSGEYTITDVIWRD